MSETAEGFESYVAIVDAGSISAAARAIEVPRETLSRRLARLEERLGVRLLHRDTRRLVPTDAGLALYRHARPLVAAAREATAAVRALDGEPRGLLRVSVPPGGGFAADLCLAFADRYPEVQLEVMSAARHVDLIAERFDVALRAGTVHDPALVARTIWASDRVAVASPGYLAHHGAPEAPADLDHHRLILGFYAGMRPEEAWPLRAGGTVPVTGWLASNDLALQLGAALAGRGIAMLPRPYVRQAIATGTLVSVLPSILGTTTSMAVVFVERAFMLPKVRAFVDHVVDWFAEHSAARELEADAARLRALQSRSVTPTSPPDSRDRP